MGRPKNPVTAPGYASLMRLEDEVFLGSRRELADALGVSANKLSSWSRGVHRVPAEAQVMAAALLWLSDRGLDIGEALREASEDLE